MKKNKKYLHINTSDGDILLAVDVEFPCNLYNLSEEELKKFIYDSLKRECWRVYSFLEEKDGKILYTKLFHGDIKDTYLTEQFPGVDILDISGLTRKNLFVAQSKSAGLFYVDVTGRNFCPLTGEASLIQLLKLDALLYEQQWAAAGWRAVKSR